VLPTDVERELAQLRKENAELRRANAILREASVLFAKDPAPAIVSRVIEKMRPAFGVEPVCRALGVPVSTYYARRNRRPSARELADRELVRHIHAARQRHRAAYGVRKTCARPTGCAFSRAAAHRSAHRPGRRAAPEYAGRPVWPPGSRGRTSSRPV